MSKRIANHDELREALARVSELMDVIDDSKDPMILAEFKNLVEQVHAYESVHFPIDPPSPEEAAKFRRDQEFVRPFRMGDVVKLARPNSWSQRELEDGEELGSSAFDLGEEHVIQEVKYDGDSFEYSTDHGAWFEHGQFDLVRECDSYSMAVLRKSMIDNGEIETDDEDEEIDDEEGMTEEEEATAIKLGAEVRGYGQAAFLQGLSIKDNPHEYPSVNWRLWREGFVAEETKKIGKL